MHAKLLFTLAALTLAFTATAQLRLPNYTGGGAADSQSEEGSGSLRLPNYSSSQNGNGLYDGQGNGQGVQGNGQGGESGNGPGYGQDLSRTPYYDNPYIGATPGDANGPMNNAPGGGRNDNSQGLSR